MKRVWIYRSAFIVGAAVVFALSSGCGVSRHNAAQVKPKFLYAASCGSPAGILGYTVEPTTGALTEIAGNPLVTGLGCTDFMATDLAQKFLYVTDDGFDELHSYAIGATGALTEVGTAQSQCVFQVAVDSSGKYLMAPDFCTNAISVYSIGADGALTAVAGSPFASSSGNSPESVWIAPSGKFVYVTEDGDPGTISVFSLAASGALTEIAGSPFTGGLGSFGISGTADGKYVYITDQTGQGAVLGFSINSTTGALTALSTPSFSGGGCWLSTDATGTVLFSTDCTENLYSFVINADGTLTAATGSPVATGSVDAYPVIGDPSGQYVYAGQDSSPGEIFAYSYSSTGVLTAVTGTPFAAAGTNIEGIIVTH